MESNRSDNRRRRVLIDESVQKSASALVAGAAEVAAPRRRRSNNYLSRRGQQLKTSDLIPTRWLTFGLIATSSLGVLALLNFLQWIATLPSEAIDLVARQAFTITAPSSVAAWVEAVAFILASLFGLQIYAMRRHRRDDYRGTYRVWLMLTVVFLVASLQCIVPLGQIGGTLLSKAIRSPVFYPGEKGLLTLKLVLLTVVTMRTLFEIRACRSATPLFIVAALAFAGAACMEVSSIAQYLAPSAVWAANNLFLFATLALLNSVIAYSRFVNLDMQGRLVRRAGRWRKSRGRGFALRNKRGSSSSRSKSNATDDSDESWSDAEEASSGPPPSQSHSSAAQKSSPLKAKMDAMKSNSQDSDDEDWEDDDESDNSGTSRLSKAERRRLKKLQRQRHAA